MSEPARPNLAFHVGVVGHGQLPAAQLSSACLKAEEFLRTVRSEVLAFRSEDAAAAKAYSPVPPQMRCFSGLSLGADMSLGLQRRRGSRLRKKRVRAGLPGGTGG